MKRHYNAWDSQIESVTSRRMSQYAQMKQWDQMQSDEQNEYAQLNEIGE